MLLKPVLLPVGSLVGTQLVKWAWEHYFANLPRVALLAIAGAISGVGNEWVQLVPDPAIATLLGVLAGQLHDAISPPKAQGLASRPPATLSAGKKLLAWAALALPAALCLGLSGPAWAQEADDSAQFLQLTPSLTEGYAFHVGSLTAAGAVVLAHTELFNYGDWRDRVDPASGEAERYRFRKVAVTACGGAASMNDQAPNGLVIPMGGCVIAYEVASAGYHYEFQNGGQLVTATVDVLKLPAVGVALWHALPFGTPDTP